TRAAARLRQLRVCDPRSRASLRALRNPDRRSRRPGRRGDLLLRVVRAASRPPRTSRPSRLTQGATMPRPIWSGAISFGLVSVPVKLYSAVHQKGVSFHQIDEASGSRIRYKRVSEKTGREV